MTSQNTPYVLEIAAMLQLPELDTESLRKAARDNGVSDAQLAEAATETSKLLTRPEAEVWEWVRQQYLADGRAQGYVGYGEPTLWVLRQLASTHYAGTTG